MKKLFASLLVFAISSQTFAAKVCTHSDFVAAYPNAAAHLGNCPRDSSTGSTVSCEHKGQIFNFYCSGSGWSVPWGKIIQAPYQSLISPKNVVDLNDDLLELPADESSEQGKFLEIE